MPEIAPILLILDVDETLLYASEKRLDRESNFRVGSYFVYVRPYLQEFLQCCNEHFRLAVWSSSSADYLNAIVTAILPNDLTLEFVWSRERCIQRFDGELQEIYYVKDLKKVQRMGFDLDRMLILDDTPKKVERNYGNAIYAKPYFGDPMDSELQSLSRYLKSLAPLANVRSIEKRGWRTRCSTHD